MERTSFSPQNMFPKVQLPFSWAGKIQAGDHSRCFGRRRGCRTLRDRGWWVQSGVSKSTNKEQPFCCCPAQKTALKSSVQRSKPGWVCNSRFDHLPVVEDVSYTKSNDIITTGTFSKRLPPPPAGPDADGSTRRRAGHHRAPRRVQSLGFSGLHRRAPGSAQRTVDPLHRYAQIRSELPSSDERIDRRVEASSVSMHHRDGMPWKRPTWEPENHWCVEDASRSLLSIAPFSDRFPRPSRPCAAQIEHFGLGCFLLPRRIKQSWW